MLMACKNALLKFDIGYNDKKIDPTVWVCTRSPSKLMTDMFNFVQLEKGSQISGLLLVRT